MSRILRAIIIKHVRGEKLHRDPLDIGVVVVVGVATRRPINFVRTMESLHLFHQGRRLRVVERLAQVRNFDIVRHRFDRVNSRANNNIARSMVM